MAIGDLMGLKICSWEMRCEGKVLKMINVQGHLFLLACFFGIYFRDLMDP